MKVTKRFLLGCAALLTAAGSVFGAEQAEPKSKFENETGWIWHLEPEPARWTSSCTQGLIMRLDELKGKKLLLTLAHSSDLKREIIRLRPVAFNASGRRFVFSDDSGGSSAGVALQGYLLDLKTLPRDQIKFLGIEALTKRNLRDVVAPASFRKLNEAGVNALPFPRMGERYDFELTAIDGKKISSKSLRGKVVLLDFWAGWCAPCMAKMQKLKKIYQSVHARGFEVIGLNHDNKLEVAKDAIAEQELPWPNVLAPVAEGQSELWWAATGTTALPRLLLIDRDGILRAEVDPHDLQAEIENLVGKQ